jgi:UDP-N-acetylmuramate dehydrogenase
LPGRAAFYAEITAAESTGAACRQERVAPLRSRSWQQPGALTGDFDGLLLHMAIGGRELIAEDDDAWYVRAGAGENWHQLRRVDPGQGLGRDSKISH